ncbi:hypothetical protein ACQJBY_023836 [Aegilops geniculata]
MPERGSKRGVLFLKFLPCNFEGQSGRVHSRLRQVYIDMLKEQLLNVAITWRRLVQWSMKEVHVFGKVTRLPPDSCWLTAMAIGQDRTEHGLISWTSLLKKEVYCNNSRF